MAITVKLTDATISLAGEFSASIAFVKSLPGRRYDAATKTNSVQMSLAEFRKAAMHGHTFQVVDGQGAADAMSGKLIGKHGNIYSNADRDAYAERKGAERRIEAEFRLRFAALKTELDQRAAAQGIPAKVAEWVASFKIDEMVERRLLQFSSPAKRQQVAALEEWYGTAFSALCEAEDDAKSDAERAIDDKYGVY